MKDKLKIHVLAVGDDTDCLIYAVFGHITTTELSDIEDALNDEDADFPPGDYVFNVSFEPDQTGEYGVIEIPGYWDFQQESFKSMADMEE